jgi:hypothetical protein
MKRSDWLLATALAVVAFASRVAFRYGDGFGDNNVIHMAVGMARSVAFETSFGDSLEYGKNFSLGVYLAFRALYPAFFDGAGAVISVLNWTGLAGGLLLYPALYAVYRMSLSQRAATYACVLVMSAPVVWENETSFQPISLALGALLLCVLAFRAAALGRTRLPLSVLLALAALSLRAEVALLAPALLLWAAQQGGRQRLLRAASVFVAAALLLALLLLLVGSDASTRGATPGEYVTRYFRAFVRGGAVARNLLWASLGIGLVNLGLCLALWTDRLRHRPSTPALRDLLVPSVAALSVLVFWISNSVPLVRHFYLMLPPMAWMIGRTTFGHRRAGLWLAAAVILNLALPELIYAGVDRLSAGEEKVAHGSFFSAHAAQSAKVRRARAFATAAADRLGELERQHDANSPPIKIAMPINWILNGYLEHELILRGVRLRETHSNRLDADLTIREFVAGSVRIRQIRSNWSAEPAIAQALRRSVTRAADEGWELWIPHEFAPALQGDGTAASRALRL